MHKVIGRNIDDWWVNFGLGCPSLIWMSKVDQTCYDDELGCILSTVLAPGLLIALDQYSKGGGGNIDGYPSGRAPACRLLKALQRVYYSQTCRGLVSIDVAKDKYVLAVLPYHGDQG